MRLKPLDQSELKTLRQGRGRPSKYLPILLEFLDSGELAGEVEVEGLNPYHVAMAMRRLARVHDLPVKVMVRNRRIILVRTDVGGQ